MLDQATAILKHSVARLSLDMLDIVSYSLRQAGACHDFLSWRRSRLEVRCCGALEARYFAELKWDCSVGVGSE